MLPLAIFGSLGPGEMLVIAIVALLVFGSRLPEVGRSLGRGLMEFKKGLSGVKDELDEVNLEAERRLEEELRRSETPALSKPDEEGEGPLAAAVRRSREDTPAPEAAGSPEPPAEAGDPDPATTPPTPPTPPAPPAA